MDDSLSALATQHGGIFTRAQALDCGYTDRDLRGAVRLGVLVRVRHGCYAYAAVHDQLDEVAKHLVLARAVMARQFGAVALTGPSAAAVHGMALYGQDLSTVHVVRLDRGSSRHEVGVRHHVLKHDIKKDLQVKGGLAVVSPARTVWEVATMSSLEAGVCTADSALRLYPEILGDLATISATFDRRPGSRQARRTVALADPGAETIGESLSRVLFHRHGIPQAKLQHPVYRDGALLAVTDFYWEEYRHVGEFDGKVKYTQHLRPGEAPADAVFREKRREDLVRGEGLGMTRWTWQDLMPSHAPAFVGRLSADLERSRRLYVRRSA